MAAGGETVNTSRHDAIPDDSTRYVFVTKTRCPVCDSADLQTIRSKTQDDGTISRRTACRTCGHRFFVILE
jgi:C4-type Zn-finger protein